MSEQKGFGTNPVSVKFEAVGEGLHKSEKKRLDLIRTFPIRKKIQHQDDLVTIYFDKVFEMQPGQFVLLWIPGIDEKPYSAAVVNALEAHFSSISKSDAASGKNTSTTTVSALGTTSAKSISISGDPTPEYLEISIKAVGPFSAALVQKREGDYIGIRGPFGNGFTPKSHALLIGGGMGVAPIRGLAQRMARDKMTYFQALGVKKPSDLIFPNEYASNSECILIAEETGFSHSGRVTDVVPSLLREKGIQHIFAAGPEGMLLKVREIAREANLPCQLSFERYMKCGVGLCGQCCLDGSGLRVCVEGPVLTEIEMSQTTELGKPHRVASGKRPGCSGSGTK
ncbi:MAG: hypothetical protein WA705_14955 [Candidatus Ozemobacteraceae bacterium]